MMSHPIATRSLMTPLLLLAALCTESGHLPVNEDNFEPQNDAEREALERIRDWVRAAAPLLDETDVPKEHKDRVQSAMTDVRLALARYDRLRDRGSTRAAVMGPVRISAMGILADDATGAGVANDFMLVPLALIAVSAYIITDAVASEAELGRAWNSVLGESRELGEAINAAVAASVGTRQTCIDRYVDCQLHARRGFPPERCQACMDLCMGNHYFWPDKKECVYKDD